MPQTPADIPGRKYGLISLRPPNACPLCVPFPHFLAQGVIPLGGCKVEPVERGPRGSKFGIKITHPDFVAGKMLVLACDKEDDQKAWLRALTDCSRV